jgi:alpha-glucosidase
VSEIDFKYANGKLSMTGSFEYDPGVTIEAITVLGMDCQPKGHHDAEYDAANKKLVLHVDVPLTAKSHIKVV